MKSALATVLAVLVFTTTSIGEITIRTIFSFDGTNGTNPEGTLVEGKDGYLYGTTRDTTVKEGNWGFHFFGQGTIFKFSTNGTLTTLFRFRGTNGGHPRSGLVLGDDGNLYGTTTGGGKKNIGTIFRITTNGVLTTLADFDGTNGGLPIAGLLKNRNHTFVGTTIGGGLEDPRLANIPNIPHGWGTVFSITPPRLIKTLVCFDRTNGCRPYVGLIRAKNGTLYGATTYGGLLDPNSIDPYNGNGFGTLFEILPTGSLKTLVIFDGTNGISPNRLVQDGAGHIFGSTKCGGNTYSVTNDPDSGPIIIQGFGTIFCITKNGQLKTLVQFDGSNGKYPSDMLLGQDGNLYGFTSEAGKYNHGTFFRLRPNGQFETLHSFSGVKDDEGISTLMQAKDGRFYGTGVGSFLGGGESYYKCGRIFRLTINP